jgi:DNA-binding NarL/FixJ family response regulator
MPKIRVAVAEDHAVVRQGLKALIRADPGLQVVGEAEDGEQAVRISDEVKPDVVVMDLAMPYCSGLEATRRIAQKNPHTKVLVLSSYWDDESVRSALGAGAMGYITKHSASDDLLRAIRQVNDGRQYLSPRIANRFKRQSRSASLSGRSAAVGAGLSRREIEVLTLVAHGFASKTIAEYLEISVKTVEKHRQSLMDKLDIHEVAGLTRYAAGKGILPPSTGPL